MNRRRQTDQKRPSCYFPRSAVQQTHLSVYVRLVSKHAMAELSVTRTRMSVFCLSVSLSLSLIHYIFLNFSRLGIKRFKERETI